MSDVPITVILNEVGDVVLDHAQMAVLADERRFALLGTLRRLGTATATELGPDVQPDLEALARVGLVTADTSDGVCRWRAAGRGLFFDIPEDSTSEHVARRLANVWRLSYADVPRRWSAEQEPGLEPAWFRAAGVLSVRMKLTADELDRIQGDMERLIETYVNRPPGEVPVGARDVQILSYFLPDGPSS